MNKKISLYISLSLIVISIGYLVVNNFTNTRKDSNNFAYITACMGERIILKADTSIFHSCIWSKDTTDNISFLVKKDTILYFQATNQYNCNYKSSIYILLNQAHICDSIQKLNYVTQKYLIADKSIEAIQTYNNN